MDFHGTLSEFHLPDIIQFLSGASKTGMLRLSVGEQEGSMFLDGGRIVHAVFSGVEGEEAVYLLAIQSSGEFHFEPGVSTRASTVHRSNTSLLMEAARRKDEWELLRQKIPSVDGIPEFVIPEGEDAGKQITLNTSEWIVLSKIDGRRSIREIAQSANLSLFHTCRLLYSLISTRLIELREPRSEPQAR